MPLELAAMAKELRFQYQPNEIHQMLVELARRRKLGITWTLRHTKYLAAIDPADRLLDATGFCDLLKRDPFDSRTANDEAGKLTRAFWPMHSHHLSDALLSARRAVIYDNTFNTSSYDLKLGVFSVVSKDGRTRLLACSLLRHEDEESFKWVMTSFLEIYGVTPAVVLTDGDPWLSRAIASVFDGSVHLLCVWHLANNVKKHIKGCFGVVGRGKASAAWHAWFSAFWRVLFQTEEATRDTFDEEWELLRELLRTSGTSSKDSISHGLEYLGGYDVAERQNKPSVYSMRHKWAYRYTWEHFTMGCNSTQRGESVFSRIKARVRPGSLLVDLYAKLHDLDDEMEDIAEHILAKQVRTWSHKVKRRF